MSRARRARRCRAPTGCRREAGCRSRRGLGGVQTLAGRGTGRLDVDLVHGDANGDGGRLEPRLQRALAETIAEVALDVVGEALPARLVNRTIFSGCRPRIEVAPFELVALVRSDDLGRQREG